MTIPEMDNDFGRRLLGERLREPGPGRIQLLSGPGQVDKTTLLLQLVSSVRWPATSPATSLRSSGF